MWVSLPERAKKRALTWTVELHSVDVIGRAMLSIRQPGLGFSLRVSLSGVIGTRTKECRGRKVQEQGSFTLISFYQLGGTKHRPVHTDLSVSVVLSGTCHAWAEKEKGVMAGCVKMTDRPQLCEIWMSSLLLCFCYGAHPHSSSIAL